MLKLFRFALCKVNHIYWLSLCYEIIRVLDCFRFKRNKRLESLEEIAYSSFSRFKHCRVLEILSNK